MKWSEYEAKSTKAQYTKALQVCGEHHTDVNRKKAFSARFCNHCYEREGWKCFPCSDIKKVYEERYGQPLEELASTRRENSLLVITRVGSL
jgi:hypothetical protein